MGWKQQDENSAVAIMYAGLLYLLSLVIVHESLVPPCFGPECPEHSPEAPLELQAQLEWWLDLLPSSGQDSTWTRSGVSLASFSLTPTLKEVTVWSDALIWIQNSRFIISLFDFPSDNGTLASVVCYHHTHTVGNPNGFSCYLFCSGDECAPVC